MTRAYRQTAGAATGSHGNPVSAVFTALRDRLTPGQELSAAPTGPSLAGKTCLITGANSGLGKAAAVQLAARGARLILACRSGIPEAGEEIRRLSGNERVTMLPVDLADLASVSRLADCLEEEKERLDLVVLNAGLMPRSARRSSQGYELMFSVHYLANRLLITRLLDSGVIPNNTRAGNRSGAAARLIIVSSEAHRSSAPIDFARLGDFIPYGIAGGMSQYAYTKLLLTTWAARLADELASQETPDVCVHTLCPGPVNSGIARETPALLKPVLMPIMSLFFRSPEKAADPVVYLACHPGEGRRTGTYLHMMEEKLPSAMARDGEAQKRLWEEGEAMLQPWLYAKGEGS